MAIHSFTWALIFFGITALIGLYMLSRVYRELPRQNGVMIVHGIAAATAIGILFYYSAFEVITEAPFASIFFFIVAVFGGIFMVLWDKIMNRKMPKYFPLFHAGAAITGIILLAIFAFNHSGY